MATRLGCKFNASTLGIQLSIHEVWQTWKLNQNSRTCNLPESKLDTLTTSCWSFASTLPPKTNKCLCKNCYCTLYILSFLICCSRSHVVPSPKVLLFVHLVIAPNQTPEVITYRFDSWRYQPNAPKPGLHSPHDISTLQARWKAWSFWFSKISIREETPRNSKKNECNMYIYIYTHTVTSLLSIFHINRKKGPAPFRLPLPKPGEMIPANVCSLSVCCFKLFSHINCCSFPNTSSIILRKKSLSAVNTSLN